MGRSAIIRMSLVALGLALGGTGTYVLPPPAVFAVDLEDIAHARKLVEEARPWFKQAADTDLDGGKRKEGRKHAYKLLKEALKIYNSYLDDHPEKEGEFDNEYSSAAQMYHFIKKMSGIWEHSPRRDHDATPDDPGEKQPETGGDSKPPDKGAGGPDSGGDSKPPTKSDDGSGPPKPPEPEPDPTERARKAYADILAYQEAHPGDSPGLYDLCMQFQAEFDPALPEYEKVALLAGAIADKLNEFFKAETDEDPDAIAKGDSKNVLAIIKKLTTTLKKGEPSEQVRAARLLGETRSGAASFALCGVLGGDDLELRAAARAGLVAIGGGRTSYNLIKKFRNERREDVQHAALDTLLAISAKSDVDARATSVPIGRFVLSRKESVAAKALDFLAGQGEIGGPGLIEALETKVTRKKIELIQALGNSGYYPGATKLCGFMPKGNTPYKAPAQEALRKMGMCAVPYMIPALRTGCKLWTAALLREIHSKHHGNPLGRSGFKTNDIRGWQRWYRENRPASGCNGYDPDWALKK